MRDRLGQYLKGLATGFRLVSIGTGGADDAAQHRVDPGEVPQDYF